MNPTLCLAFDLLAKSAGTLLLAFAVQRLWPRVAASRRCLVWFAAFTIVGLLPLTRFAQPLWAWHWPEKPVSAVVQTVPLITDSAEVNTDNVQSQLSAPGWRTDLSLTEALGLLWLAGAILVLALRASGSLQLRRLEKQSRPVTDKRILALAAELAAEAGVRRVIDLRESGEAAVPLTWGWRKPVLVLPAASRQWSHAELEAALRHELGHIRHGDALTRWLMCVVCALQWPNVVVWLAARAWRTAQEQACDDLVVAAGSGTEAYAMQLLNAASAVQVSGLIRVPAMAMAQPSTLEQRLCAIMDETRDRRPLHGAAWLAAVGVALVVLAVCATMQVRAGDKAVPDSDASSPIEISTKLMEVDRRNASAAALLDSLSLKPGGAVLMSGAHMEDFLQKLNKQKGVDLLSTPRVLTMSGHQASIEVGRELMTPENTPEGQKVGVFLTLFPELLAKDRVKLSLDGLVREFEGFRDDPATGKKLPIFLERKTKCEVLFARQDTIAVVMAGPGPESRSEEGKTTKDVLYVISTKVVTQAGVQATNNHSATTIGADGKVSSMTKSSPVQVEVKADVDNPWTKAEKIIIPRMELRDAKLEEALDFLRVKSKELDPDKQGVNIILANPTPARDARITLSLINVPLTEALRYVTELAGLKLGAAENAFVLDAK